MSLTPNDLISQGTLTLKITTQQITSLGNLAGIGEVRPPFAHPLRPANQDDAAIGGVNVNGDRGIQHHCPEANCRQSFATVQGLGQHRRRAIHY